MFGISIQERSKVSISLLCVDSHSIHANLIETTISFQFHSTLNIQITTIPQDGEYDIYAIDYSNTDSPVSCYIL